MDDTNLNEMNKISLENKPCLHKWRESTSLAQGVNLNSLLECSNYQMRGNNTAVCTHDNGRMKILDRQTKLPILLGIMIQLRLAYLVD